MNKTRNFLVTAIVLITFGVFGCSNDPDGTNPDGTKDGGGTGISLSAFVADVSPFLNYEWDREGTEYQWLSAADGTISIGDGKGGASDCCCGLGLVMTPSYFFNGNCLITYTPEMDEADRLMTFTLSEKDRTLTRNIVTSRGETKETVFNFKRGNARGTVSSKKPLDLSKNKIAAVLLGSWKGREDGKKYVFSSDGGLKINSEQYGYLVKQNGKLLDLVIIGPLVKDKPVSVYKKYNYTEMADINKVSKIYLHENGELVNRLEPFSE